MKFLSIDVGEKRLGVARGDSNTRIAVPVGYIERNGLEWQKLAGMARLNHVTQFVIGLPRSNEGNETAQTEYARIFADTLQDKLPQIEVHFQDETLTSVVAEERLKNRGKPYEKGDIDAEAATIILQDFLESYRPNIPTSVKTKVTPNKTKNTPNTANSTLEELANLPPSELSPAPAPPLTPTSTKQGAENMKKKSKKSKKSKGKTALKWISGIVIVAVLAVAAVGGFLYFREQRRTERAAEYARQEAEMQPKVFDFTVRPGEELSDIRQHLLEIGYAEDEVDQAFEANYDFPMLANRPSGVTLEGFLYGETNQFYTDTPVTEVLEFYLGEMQKVIDDNNLEELYADQGLTLYEGITLASIVQKEAPIPDMPTVAQVFLTRLEAGIPLGSDVTVSYAVDAVDPDRDSYADNQAALGIDSCYNTRQNEGLPCGPISNPGLDALLAVAGPSDTSYLYFLTGDDGLMYYSYTEDEHNQNAAEHCQDLCQVSL